MILDIEYPSTVALRHACANEITDQKCNALFYSFYLSKSRSKCKNLKWKNTSTGMPVRYESRNISYILIPLWKKSL
jgi:hypothetical protein